MPDMPNDMGAGGEMGAETPAPADASPKSEQNTVMLSADHFPKGMVPKSGDKLTFCVTSDPDQEGNVSGYFEAAAGEESASADWEKGFKASMSPMAKESESA